MWFWFIRFPHHARLPRYVFVAAEGKGDEAFFQDIGGVKVDLRKAVNDIRFMTEAER